MSFKFIATCLHFSSIFQALSDDEEETKRIVRSAREKRYEALNTIIHSIRNSKKIKDFTKMESGFVDLTKAYEKAKPVVDREENGVTPRFFVRVLVELEDLINETWEDKEYRKKMNKNNSKSLGAMRQKLRKYIKEFEDDMAKFRENPDEPDEEVTKDDASDEDDNTGGKAFYLVNSQKWPLIEAEASIFSMRALVNV